MGAGVSGIVLAAGLLAITGPGITGPNSSGGAGLVQQVQDRDRDRDYNRDRDNDRGRDEDRDRDAERDWNYRPNDKDWDRGGEGRGRRATSRREQRASEFIAEYYRHSTESTPDAYKFVAAAYAPEVNYYGKRRSREGVLADKFAWMERWPVRNYVVQQDSAQWQCNENARLCVVKVLVDFDARNPATGKVSRGVTTNEIGVAVTNSDVQIEYENGKVLARGR